MAAILGELLPYVLPTTLAIHVAFNSEGYLVALLVAPWIQFARPRLVNSKKQWPITMIAAFACLAVGIWLYRLDAADMPSRFKTLNEAVLAVGFVIPYVQVRRPLPPAVPAGLSLALLALIAFGQSNTLVIGLAEMLGVLVLMPVALDLVDRGILQRDGRTSPAARYAWYAFLVLFPVVCSLTQRLTNTDDGVIIAIAHYTNRADEAFAGVILVELYFAVGLGRSGVQQREKYSGKHHADSDFRSGSG
ncbi:MAG: hypothetical protein H0V07_01070 [Propionibacteriales bacterium]|nr:hypothetical protein [Propionibacteriales bacterium]